jgi:hypothetical protein
MNELQGQKTKSLKELEDVISKAIKKIGASKEKDLCRYLPTSSGGYMHHFTLRKMKTKQPQELFSMLDRYILSSDKPLVVPPKKRAPRGSRKRRDQVNFSRIQLERMLHIAKLAGDKDIIAVLSPKKSLASCKKELVLSIRQGRVEQDLWSNYVDAINAQQAVTNALTSGNLIK